jgi:tetratricopeptide (TPR) repeat protein
LFQQGKSQEAVAALEKALAADPKHWKAHNNMALASIDLGELEVAEAHYRESLAIDPQPAIYNDLGFVLDRQGLTEEAAELYRKSLELDPESPSAHYNLAASLAERGEYADAEGHFRAALEVEPSAKAYSGLGFALWQQGRVDEAIARLHDAIEADPEYPVAYDQLGTILAEQGKAEEAAATYRLLVRYAPSAAAHQKLAEVLMRLGRRDEARVEMELAKALDRNPGEAR